jgi:hypothetical protein
MADFAKGLLQADPFAPGCCALQGFSGVRAGALGSMVGSWPVPETPKSQIRQVPSAATELVVGVGTQVPVRDSACLASKTSTAITTDRAATCLRGTGLNQ